MPGLSLAPVNFGAATEPNAMAQIGQALSGSIPTDVAQRAVAEAG